MRRPLPFALLVAFGIFLDQLSKILIFQYVPEHQSLPILSGIIHLTPVFNTGVAFSMFQNYPMVVLAISGIAVPLLVWWYARGWDQAPAMLLWGQGLLLVGAIGNLIDRLWIGQVRDFIDFQPQIPLIGHWAVFNFADACICVGVGLFLCAELFRKENVASRESQVKASDDRAIR
jgi:signal peptidase II